MTNETAKEIIKNVVNKFIDNEIGFSLHHFAGDWIVTEIRVHGNEDIKKAIKLDDDSFFTIQNGKYKDGTTFTFAEFRIDTGEVKDESVSK